MIKISDEDMGAALLLSDILDDVAAGKYPRGLGGQAEEGDPEMFDASNPYHLMVFFGRVTHCSQNPPGGVGRVVRGLREIMIGIPRG
jgi:hypothetical protein